LAVGRKYKLCLEVTCGDKGETAKLCERQSSCMKAECDDCPSLQAAWSDFEAWLLDDDAADEGRREHAVLTIQRRWKHYAYRKKPLTDKQKLWENSRSNDDPDYKPKTESRELYLKGASRGQGREIACKAKLPVHHGIPGMRPTCTHTHVLTHMLPLLPPPARHTEVDGTLAEFVEAFIPVLDLHLRHRSTLDRQTLSALQYHQNARPGMLGFDVDYGQNFDVKKALEVQSEHWNTLSVTLFMEIASWIKTAEWDKSEGALEAGAEVTVHGEKAGDAVNMASFWATVTVAPMEGSDVYTVRDGGGKDHNVCRSELRHRAWREEAFLGVSGDKVHDSYSMRTFRSKCFDSLKDRDVLDEENIKAFCTHSDNAAQHFKSGKTLEWYSRMLGLFDNTRFVWDFGCPGHGE